MSPVVKNGRFYRHFPSRYFPLDEFYTHLLFHFNYSPSSSILLQHMIFGWLLTIIFTRGIWSLYFHGNLCVCFVHQADFNYVATWDPADSNSNNNILYWTLLHISKGNGRGRWWWKVTAYYCGQNNPCRFVYIIFRSSGMGWWKWKHATKFLVRLLLPFTMTCYYLIGKLK